MIQFPWPLVSFTHDGTRLGVLEDDIIHDLSAVWELQHHTTLSGVRQLLTQMPMAKFADWVNHVIGTDAPALDREDVSLCVPVTDPHMLYDFLGFEKHVAQVRARRGAAVPPLWYERPAYYVGTVAPDKTWGPDETIEIPAFVTKPDYEFELAVVIGREISCVDEDRAVEFLQNYCFFTIYNDWSARDYQQLDMQLGISVVHSKSIIGNSFGPVLVHGSCFTFDANGCPDIPMRLTVNGVARCESNCNTAYWSFAKILTFLGREGIRLYPGDIIGSGTVGDGCIAEFAAKMDGDREVEPARYPWLKTGDRIIMEAGGIGTLTNAVRVVAGV